MSRFFLALVATLATSTAIGGVFQCGDRQAAVEHLDGQPRLRVGEAVFQMRAVSGTSGVGYIAVDDDSTRFWDSGEKAVLVLQGKTYPECVAVPPPPFRATGNEPSWRLDIGNETLTLKTQADGLRITAPAPKPDHEEGLVRYRVDNGGQGLTVTVKERLCVDSMTGMPHPSQVSIELDGEQLSGCGGDPADLLKGGEWVVETIAGKPPVVGSQVSLSFADEGRVSGAASCNRFMGGYTLSGEGLSLSEMGTTMMACDDAVMAQEHRFLTLLPKVSRFTIGEDGALTLHTADERTIEARRP